MINIAIDGPSGAGKSTLSRKAAAALGFLYIDTGALYRTVGLAAVRAGIAPTDTQSIAKLPASITVSLQSAADGQHVFLNGEDVTALIRTEQVSAYASIVSAVPQIRAFLLDTQRQLAADNNVVMDGRDIGTVVLPHAQLKIFLTASAEAHELHLVAGGDGFGDGINGSGQRLLGVLLGKAGLLSDLSDEFNFVHDKTSFVIFLLQTRNPSCARCALQISDETFCL